MHLEADDYSDEDEPITQVQSTEQPITFSSSDVQFERQVLLAVLAPIGHTYLTVAEQLVLLLGNVVPEAEFIKECVTSIKDKVDSDRCQFGKNSSQCSILAITNKCDFVFSREHIDRHDSQLHQVARKMVRSGAAQHSEGTPVIADACF